jgi:CRISPR-associated protein Csx10
MKRALLILTPAERAIFSARAASEGVHRGRPHPTGASLLGWAARMLYNKLDAARAWHIFHSGAVRFSDALPVVHDGHVAFPAPKLLVSLKSGGEPVVSDGGRLVADRVWVGRKAFKNANPTGQGDALKLAFLTDQLEVFSPPSDGRLRTATEEGRAKRQAMFGYGHLEPVLTRNGAADSATPVRYAATIEGDLTDREWEMLRAVFTREPLRLGRAAATSYGGWYACTWNEETGYLDYWQEQPFRDDLGSKPLRVWLLSDLAVVDDFGAPCFRPTPKQIGLPEGGELDDTESLTETRRYAPWNGALNGRDIERQVIAAGSVLSYRYQQPIPLECRMPVTTGLFQEQGLGRLWVDPPMLRGSQPAAPAEEEAVPAAASAGTIVLSRPDEPEAPPSAIARWARDRAERSNTDGRDALRDRWIKELNDLLRRTDKDGPSPSQWKEAANAARGARDLADLVTRLFDSQNAVCGDAQQRTREGDWLAGTPPVREWLRRRLEEARDKPLDHIRWALDHLARDRAQRLRAGKEERRHG